MPKAQGKLQEIKEAFAKIYLLEDPYIIDVLCANYISFFLKADPIWTVIVGPSSGGKSEMVNALNLCNYVYPISTITANTIVSGAKLGAGKPASLLHKLSKGTDMEGNGIILFKDLTSLMSEQDQTRKAIMGQLREVYDGKYVKEFGTGNTVAWAGKVTVIAAATYKIHDMRQEYAAMGERFLFYELIQPDRKGASDRGMSNQESGEIAEARVHLQNLLKEYLCELIEIPTEMPPISPEIKSDVIDLAEMTTRSRSDVKRAWFSPQKEILEVFPPEMPTRFASCLQTLARSLMILNWNETGNMELTEGHKRILQKYALDSIPMGRREAMKELSKYDLLSTAGLGLKLDKPTSTLRRHVEDLVALGLALKKEKGKGNQGDKWAIKPHYRELIMKFEGIVNEGGELTEDSALSDDEILADAMEQREKLDEHFDEHQPPKDIFDL